MVGSKIDKVKPIQDEWFTNLKEWIQFDKILEEIKSSKNILIDVGLYGSIGFLTGFFLRRYSHYIIVLVLITAVFVMLEQFGFVDVVINWSHVYDFLGLQTVSLKGDLLSIAWEVIKVNALVSISFVVGFLIGLKVG